MLSILVFIIQPVVVFSIDYTTTTLNTDMSEQESDFADLDETLIESGNQTVFIIFLNAFKICNNTITLILNSFQSSPPTPPPDITY